MAKGETRPYKEHSVYLVVKYKLVESVHATFESAQASMLQRKDNLRFEIHELKGGFIVPEAEKEMDSSLAKATSQGNDEDELPENLLEIVKGRGTIFAGMLVHVTGTLPNISHNDAQKLNTRYAGKVARKLNEARSVDVGEDISKKKFWSHSLLRTGPVAPAFSEILSDLL